MKPTLIKCAVIRELKFLPLLNSGMTYKLLLCNYNCYVRVLQHDLKSFAGGIHEWVKLSGCFTVSSNLISVVNIMKLGSN